MFSAMALYASLFVSVAVAMPGAMPWAGPMPTPISLMAMAGISPRPTEAPGSNGIPQELRRRGIQFPPPANWCGFVEGLYNVPLSCSVGMTCVNSRAALGCCTATTGICTNLYTTCANFGDTCNEACQLDPAIRKCSDADLPFCGTYSFAGGSSLYNCDRTAALPYSVEFLNDYYMTAIGSTLAAEPTANPFGFTASVALPLETASGSATEIGTSSPSNGLSTVAIDGIAAAAAIIGVAIFALVVFCCVRQRKRKRLAKSAASFPNVHLQQPAESMQQQQPGFPPKAFDGYHSVPQQEQRPQYTNYPSPPQQQASTGYFPPPGATSGSAISPMQTGTSNSDPRLSTANTTLLSPVSEPGSDQRQSYYKPPLSPTVTEVDATMGNPGIPSPSGWHGRPTEVDGTMGNPGVPAEGHGIAQQTQPGGSPSAVEIDGRMGMGGQRLDHGNIPQGVQQTNGGMRASTNQANPEGPYEIGQVDRK